MVFDSQKLLMQTENYIIVWKHHSQNNKGDTNGTYSNNHINNSRKRTAAYG